MNTVFWASHGVLLRALTVANSGGMGSADLHLAVDAKQQTVTLTRQCMDMAVQVRFRARLVSGPNFATVIAPNAAKLAREITKDMKQAECVCVALGDGGLNLEPGTPPHMIGGRG